MDMLLGHVQKHAVPTCIVHFLTTLACSASMEKRRDIMNNPSVTQLVEAATADGGSTGHATKLKALFATSSATNLTACDVTSIIDVQAFIHHDHDAASVPRADVPPLLQRSPYASLVCIRKRIENRLGLDTVVLEYLRVAESRGAYQ